MHKPSASGPAGSLDAELKATHDLLRLLKQEQQQLIEADVEGLTALTEEKTSIVAHLSALANARHAALAHAGFPPQEEGMQAWLGSPAATAGATRAWSELLALAQAGKELNRTNGLLIGKHLARNQNALNVLRGNAQGGNFYGPDGQTTMGGTSRSLIVG